MYVTRVIRVSNVTSKEVLYNGYTFDDESLSRRNIEFSLRHWNDSGVCGYVKMERGSTRDTGIYCCHDTESEMCVDVKVSRELVVLGFLVTCSEVHLHWFAI